MAQADTLPELFQQIQAIARLTGAEDAARRKLPGLMARAQRLEDAVQDLPKPLVFLQIDQEPLITVGRLSIHNDLIERAGGVNIAGHIDQRSGVQYGRVLGRLGSSCSPAWWGRGPAGPGGLWRHWTMLPAVRRSVYLGGPRPHRPPRPSPGGQPEVLASFTPAWRCLIGPENLDISS
jgi:hypothetical protein